MDALIRIGVLTPHAAIGPEAEFPEMAPDRVLTRVVRVTGDPQVDGDGGPASTTELRAASDLPLLERATSKLVADGVDVIGYASTTSAYAIGFDAEAQIVSRLSQVAGVAVASTCASALLALRVLDVKRVALIGAPWFSPELNELGSHYFRGQGFEVVSSASAQLPSDLQGIEPTAVSEWVSRHLSDDAQAVFIGGNGFRVAGAIDHLEAVLGRPVLTSNQVLLWDLLARAGDSAPVDGFGRLFQTNRTLQK